MKSKFVRTENVTRFMSAFETLEGRAAREAGFMLVHGGAGYGKSRAGTWFASQYDAVAVTLKAISTPGSMLREIVQQLGVERPRRTANDLFAQAVDQLVATALPLVIDEAEHGLGRGLAIMETIRALADQVLCPVIVIGRENVRAELAKQPQIFSRIAAEAAFRPLTAGDVSKIAAERCEVEIGEALITRIHRESEGRIRSAVLALGEAERQAQTKGWTSIDDAAVSERLTLAPALRTRIAGRAVA